MAIGGSPPNAPRDKDGTKGTAGRYGFVAEVARGYLGTLWLARDPSDTSERGTVLVRHVVPIATASAKAALLEGARWAHATGAPTLEILENRNGLDVVTTFSDVEPLRALLRTASLKHVNVTPDVLLGIVKALVDQLDSMHDAASGQKSPHGYGGVHPDSILVGTDGHVELIDCGVGSAASSREPWRSDPQRIGYQAPEQADVKGVVDARTDVFSIGVIVWEAFANKRLFPAVDAKSARDRLLKGTIARLDATKATASAPAVPTEVASFVARALERDPAARFQSVEEMGKAIDALGPASAAQIGAWAASLGDVVIAKRRQMLERTSIAPPASGRPSVAPRASVPPAAARPSVAPSMASQAPPKPAGARSSVPPPAPAAAEAAKTAAPATSAAEAAKAAAPAASAAEAAKTAAPATSAAEAAKAAAPATSAAEAAKTAAPATSAATPTSATAPSAPRPSSTVPSAPRPSSTVPTPPTPAVSTTAATPAAPQATEAAATPVPSSATPDSDVPSTEPSAADVPAEPSPDYDDEPASKAETKADSSAATTEIDDAPRSSDAAIVVPDTGRPEEGEMEVADEELGTSPTASPEPVRAPSQRPMSLPPKLPPQAHHDGAPDTSLLGAATEAPAGLMKVSEFSALTAKPVPRKRRFALATIAAMVGGLLVGFVVLGRLTGKREKIVPVQAAAGAVVIVAQEPVPSAIPSASAAASASATPPAAAPPAESAEPTPSAAPAATEAKTPETPPSTGTGTSPSAPSGGSHHAAPHGPVNSGYKPGGI